MLGEPGSLQIILQHQPCYEMARLYKTNIMAQSSEASTTCSQKSSLAEQN